MEIKTKAYGYIRVSTKEQNEVRQVIALQEVGVSEKNIYMLDGDVMLLCSDGLYKSLSAAEIADIICQYVGRPSFLPGVLTAAAFDKDLPHQDNTTVIVITCRKDSNKQQEERQL